MKKQLFLFLLIGSALFLISLRFIPDFGTVSKKEESPSFYLVNVLDKREYDDAHIKGSIHVPFGEVSRFLNSISDQSIPLIFYCSNYYCTSSDAAAKIAIKKNFKNVLVYKGGMAEWYQAGQEDKEFAYEGAGKADYLRVVILPEEVLLNEEEDIVDEDSQKTPHFKIISINSLQNFLKTGRLIL